MKSINWLIYMLPTLLLTLLLSNCSRNDVVTPTAIPIAAIQQEVPLIAQRPPTTIRIGIAIDQTGKDNAPGRDQQIGLDLAESYFRDYQCDNPTVTSAFCLEFVYRDARSENSTAADAFNTLIYTDNVSIIIGPTYSEQAFHVYPMAEDAGVPVIGPSTTADDIPQIGEYIARVSAPVAVIYQADDQFTLSETRAFTLAVESNRLTLAIVES